MWFFTRTRMSRVDLGEPDAARRARTPGRCSAARGRAAPSRAGRCRRSRGHEGSSRQPNACPAGARHGVRCAGRAPAGAPRPGVDQMQVGVIGLGNIGGHVAANLVTDGHDVVVFDVDAERAASIEGARAVASVGRGRRRQRGDGAVAADARRRARGGRRVGDDRGRRARCSSTSRPTAPRSCATLGARLVGDRPPPGRSAAHRRRDRRPEPHALVHGRRRRRRGRAGAAGARTARARVQPPRPARARQHHEAGQQPHRVHHDVGEPRGPVARGEVGHPRAAGGRGAAHQRRRQLLPRPHGREHRHPQRARRSSRSSSRPRTPASSSRPAARSACPTPAGAAVLQVLVGAIAGGLGDHDWGDLVAAAERQGDVELHWNTDPDHEVASPEGVMSDAHVTQPRVSRRCRGRRRRRGGRRSAAGTPA